ncbi:cytochrome c [Bradyrhizobium japonicum]|nr:cytochrome c [Bradyrhizobium japonicum]
MFPKIRFGIAISISISAALFLVRMHKADGFELAADSTMEGHRLAEAWCKPCHGIEPGVAGISDQAPSFAAIAKRHGTTALSLKVFLKTSHHNMPNLVIAPDQADALANYILSLKAPD